jgi:hypothetical protein
VFVSLLIVGVSIGIWKVRSLRKCDAAKKLATDAAGAGWH